MKIEFEFKSQINTAITLLNVMSRICAYSTKETRMFTEDYLLPYQERV